MTRAHVIMASCSTVFFAVILLLSASEVPAASGGEVRLSARMVSGVASGKADYRERGSRRRLNVEAEDLPATTPSPQAIFVNGAQVGTMTLAACPVPAQQLLCGEMELNTQDGQVVPTVLSGQIVSIGQNPAVLAGTFR